MPNAEDYIPALKYGADLTVDVDANVVDDLTVGEAGSTGATATVISQNANALAVGRQGTTAPAFKVDSSASSSATGMEVVSAAAASGVTLRGISSGTNESIAIDAKGSGTITLAGTSTGNVVVPRTFVQGTDATDRVAVKGIYMTPANVAVAVPSITDPDIARVQVDVSSAFSIQPAVGDAVIAIPQEALPTNARLQGAFVYQTDGIEICFGSEGGNVTGASKNFKFLVIDLT